MYFFKGFINSLKKVATYARNFGLSLITDISVFAIIIHISKPILGSGPAILISSLIARVTSSLVNFKLNRALFSAKKGSEKRALVRYYTLWLGLLTSSVIIIYTLNNIFGLKEVTGKLIADISLGILSYQVQMRWVFKGREDGKRGLYFRIVRMILRPFWKRQVIIDESLFKDGLVLVGHHQSFYGPIISMMWLPDTVNIWVVSHLFAFKQCFNMFYNHTFKKTIKMPRIIALVMAGLCGLLIPPMIRSIGAIPVYRQSKKIVETFEISMDLLDKGQQILIFPDIEYYGRDNLIGDIHNGFAHLEKLYFRSHGDHLGFVPIILDKANKVIRTSKPIYFNDHGIYEEERDILIKEIIYNINLQYS